MSPILFFIIFFICTGVGKIFLQINSAAVAFIDILIAAWEGLKKWNGYIYIWTFYDQIPRTSRTALVFVILLLLDGHCIC